MKIPCSIMKDLLPNFIDNCTSEESNACIKKHLEECESCNALYKIMKEPLPYDQQQGIRFLKKIKKRNTRRIIIAVTMTFLLCICGILVKTYAIGSRTTNLIISEVQLNKNVISAYVAPLSMKDSIYDMELISDQDEQFISYQLAPSSFFHKDNGVKQVEINVSDIKGYLLLGDFVFDRAGNVYNRMVYDLFKNRLSYVGDAQGVEKLISMAFSTIGNKNFKLELDTVKEPYAITVRYENGLDDFEISAITKAANLVLASIDNCNIMKLMVADKVVIVENSIKSKSLKELQRMVVDNNINKLNAEYTFFLKKEQITLRGEYSSLTIKLADKNITAEERNKLEIQLSQVLLDIKASELKMMELTGKSD